MIPDLLEDLCFYLSPPLVLYWEVGGGHNVCEKIKRTKPQSGRSCAARPFANTRRAARPPSRLFFFLEVTRARLHSDPRPPSRSAGEEGRKELPVGSPPLGVGERGSAEAAGPGTRRRAEGATEFGGDAAGST